MPLTKEQLVEYVEMQVSELMAIEENTKLKEEVAYLERENAALRRRING